MGENRIKKYLPYGLGFDMLENTLVVHIKYPNKWKVMEPTEGSSLKTFFDKPSGRQYYWIDDSSDMDEILDSIDDTIEFNKDMEERMKLLKEKIEELHTLFSEKDLEELNTLEFVFASKKKKTTTKGKKTKTLEETITETKAEVTVDSETSEVNINRKSFDGEQDYFIPKKEESESEGEAFESDIDKKIANAMKNNRRKTGE